MHIEVSRKSRSYVSKERCVEVARQFDGEGVTYMVVPYTWNPERFTAVFFLTDKGRWSACAIANFGFTVVA